MARGIRGGDFENPGFTWRTPGWKCYRLTGSRLSDFQMRIAEPGIQYPLSRRGLALNRPVTCVFRAIGTWNQALPGGVLQRNFLVVGGYHPANGLGGITGIWLRLDVKAKSGAVFRQSNERDLQTRFRLGRDGQSRAGFGRGV